MKQKKKKSSGWSTVVLVVIFLAGLSLLLYPTLSNYVNSLNQSVAIGDYTQKVDALDVEKYADMRAQAQKFNQTLLDRENRFVLPKELEEEYNKTLNVTGTGIMGYVEIPCIDCTLPIYHGTDDAVLQVAVGHLEWSSLPIGGPSTHSVISGHRGLPSAKLLSDIDRMEIGDAFYIHVLDQELKYRVDDISVVLPEDTNRLRVVEGKDYMTLVTCTPYGVNSHRLLVRGVRVDDDGASTGTTLLLNNEIKPIHPMYVIPVAVVLVLAVMGLVMWIDTVRIKRKSLRLQEETQGNGAQICPQSEEN